MTQDEMHTLMKQVEDIHAVLLGVPGTDAKGICGEVLRLRNGQIELDRRLQHVEDACAVNHKDPPVQVVENNEFVIRKKQRQLVWWMTLIVTAIAAIITFLISGVDYFNIFNRAAG